MTGFENWTVEDLRNELIKLGKTKGFADGIKGKSNLVYELLMARGEVPTQEEKSVNFEEFEEDTAIISKNPYTPLPKYGTKEWQNYVMSQFTPDELNDGAPTCNGLRRVAEELLGEIVFSAPTQVFPATDSNGPGRATVVFTVKIAWKLGLPEYVDINSFEVPVREFGDVSDCWTGNTEDKYAVHPSATASTRAEGRALRKALKLNVVTAEEKANDKDASEVVAKAEEKIHGRQVNWDGGNVISSSQVNFITNKCRQLGLDVEKFINIEFYCYNKDNKLVSPKYTDISDVPRDVAVKMIEQLVKYQSNSDDKNESVEIPEEIKLKGE